MRPSRNLVKSLKPCGLREFETLFGNGLIKHRTRFFEYTNAI